MPSAAPAPAAPARDPLDDGALAPPPPPLPPAPAPPLVRRLGGLARRAAWRVMHPAAREPYLPQPRPRPLDRLYFESIDGWRAPLLWAPPAPGGPGEPVVLAHALGLSPDAFRLDDRRGLVGCLTRAGFSVYLLCHRGDAAAIPPDGARPFDFDDILERDVPAALARVREHSGFVRAHWVGHGLGGQLGLAWAARGGPGALASVVSVGAPVVFAGADLRTEVRRAARVAALLPGQWRLPTSAVGWAVAPWIGDGAALDGLGSAATAGPDARGLLCFGTGDLAAGIVAQVGRWLAAGSWTDRSGLLDYAESLRGASGPLLVVASPDDVVCPAAAALAALDAWGEGPRERVVVPGYGHVDPLTAGDAQDRVAAPIVAFLDRHRRRAWPDPSDPVP
jgi:pimeloyl-ACP methyl ester carboxylesterase